MAIIPDSKPGDKFWYKFIDLHREDGPAVERADGSVEWWFNGHKMSFSCWLGYLTQYIGKSHAADMKAIWANYC